MPDFHCGIETLFFYQYDCNVVDHARQDPQTNPKPKEEGSDLELDKVSTNCTTLG